MTATSNKGFPPVQESSPNDVEHRREMARRINQINSGKFNCTVDATLRANQTTTTLTDARIFSTSGINEMPLSANAATARASVWYSGAKKGSITINHASSANVDQNFRFTILA